MDMILLSLYKLNLCSVAVSEDRFHQRHPANIMHNIVHSQANDWVCPFAYQQSLEKIHSSSSTDESRPHYQVRAGSHGVLIIGGSSATIFVSVGIDARTNGPSVIAASRARVASLG